MFLWTLCLRRPDEGAMFFLKREHTNGVNLKDSLTHHSYGKWSAFLINMHCQNTVTFLSGFYVYLGFPVNAEVPWTSDTSQFWKCSIFWQDVNVLLRISVFSFAKRGFVINFPTLVLSLLNLITLFFYPAAPASGAACVTFLRSVLSKTLGSGEAGMLK